MRLACTWILGPSGTVDHLVGGPVVPCLTMAVGSLFLVATFGLEAGSPAAHVTWIALQHCPHWPLVEVGDL